MANATLEKLDGQALASQETARAVTVAPRVDIIETESELRVLADLPGVAEGDVDIRFENGELSLRAKRGGALPAATALLWEFEAGDYFRAFRITELVDATKIAAELRDGVLTLHLPKVEAAKPRKIAVRAG